MILFGYIKLYDFLIHVRQNEFGDDDGVAGDDANDPLRSSEVWKGDEELYLDHTLGLKD